MSIMAAMNAMPWQYPSSPSTDAYHRSNRRSDACPGLSAASNRTCWGKVRSMSFSMSSSVNAGNAMAVRRDRSGYCLRYRHASDNCSHADPRIASGIPFRTRRLSFSCRADTTRSHVLSILAHFSDRSASFFFRASDAAVVTTAGAPRPSSSK